MRLFEFFPIRDLVVDGESLIERVFGPEFCVVDESGGLLTTKHNQLLLQRVKALLDEVETTNGESVEKELKALSAQGLAVTQHDYDVAVRREILYRDMDHTYDHSLQAGSLS
jgi:hypothetical protein